MATYLAPVVIALFTLLLPFWVEAIRKDRPVLLGICAVVIIHQLAVVMITYVVDFKAATGDALFFHERGLELSESEGFYFGIGAVFFHNFLGIAYRAFGASRLLGVELSHLAFTFSLVTLLKIMVILELRNYRAPILLVYGLMPSLLLVTVGAFREPWQILFFMMSVYWGLKYRKSLGSTYFILMLLSSIALALFHKALIVYSVMLVSLFILWPKSIDEPVGLRWQRKVPIFMAIICVSVLMFWWVAEYLGGEYGGEVVKAIMRGYLLEYINDYHDILAQQKGRAGYEVLLNTSSWPALMGSWIVVYFEYLFSPFPWQLENIYDLYAFCEGLLRLMLILLSAYFAVKETRERRYDNGLLLMCYLLMTALWSIGTANYGQAIRHHVVSEWVILITGLPLFLRWAERNLAVLNRKRQALP